MLPSRGPQKCPLKLILVDVYPRLFFLAHTLVISYHSANCSPLCAVPSHCSRCTVSSGLESAYFFQMERSTF